MKKQLTIWGLAAVMMCGMNSCSCRSAHDDDADRQREEGTERGDVIPQKPDYGDASQWYSVNRGGTGDLFYITSTETGDYLLSDGTMCHHADTYRDSLRLPPDQRDGGRGPDTQRRPTSPSRSTLPPTCFW